MEMTMNKSKQYVPAIGLRAVSSKERITHLEERLAAFEESERKLVRELAEANTISGKKTGEIAMLQEKCKTQQELIQTLNRIIAHHELDKEVDKITYQVLTEKIVNVRLNIEKSERTK